MGVSMKRNLDLYRGILLKLRDDENPDSLIGEYTKDEVHYHAWLALQDELAEGIDVTDIDHIPARKAALLTSLTPAGHDFVEGAANVKVWQAAMEKIRVYGSDVGIQIVSKVMASIIKSTMGLP
jgi:hypothetical protein